MTILPAAARSWRVRQGREPTQAVATALLLLVSVLVVVPLGAVIWSSLGSDPGAGVAAVRRALGGSGAGELARNTVVFTVGSALFATTVGGVLAYLFARTDIPCRRLLVLAALVPLAIPGLLYAFSWTLLMSPRMGALAGGLAILPGPPPDPFSLSGMVFVEGLHLSPIAFLLLAGAFRSLDPAMEEAAVLACSRRRAVWRITLPLVRPALAATLLLTGLRAVEGFEVPALLGLPGRVPVLTTRLFTLLRGFPPDQAGAGAVALLLVAIAAVGLVAQRRSLGSRDRFELITGRRQAAPPVPLGAWRRVLGAGVVGWFAISVAAPVGILGWASLLPYYQRPSVRAASGVSLDTFRTLIADGALGAPLRRSLVLGAAAATIAVVLGAAVAWIVARTTARGRATLDAMALAPLVTPGLVLGLGISYVWLRLPGPVAASSAVLLVAYVVAFLPYAVRYGAAALQGVSAELEDAGRVAGAAWPATVRRVLVPLAGPGLAAAWLSIVVLSLRELTVSLLLYRPGKEVFPVLFWELWEDGRLPEIAALGLILLAALGVVLTPAYLLARRTVLPDLQ